MASKHNLEYIIASIEKRRLAIEEKRTVFQFETAFFLPLLALLFLITYFSTSEFAKLFFYILTVIFILADLIYSVIVYNDMNNRQKKLDALIHEKLSN